LFSDNYSQAKWYDPLLTFVGRALILIIALPGYPRARFPVWRRKRRAARVR